MLQRHYQLLSKMSVDSVFDADWKEEVGDNVKGYSSLSEEVTDSLLDKEIEKGEITKCLRNLKNSKTGGSDRIVGELLKYGGFGMVDLLEQLFSVIWQEEIVPRQWREGLIVNIFKKGDREDPANYRGITLLSVVGKVFCKILNNRLVQCLDKEGALHEGQAGFRTNRSCMDNVYTLNEIVQGRLREDKKTYAFFLAIQKAYDSVWHDGLWYKLWDVGVKGRMWRVIKKMYESSKSAVLLEGEKSDTFTIEQGVAQGCSLSPILFSVFVNDLLKEVEQTGLGIQLSSGKTVGGMLFADDFVGISESRKFEEGLNTKVKLGMYKRFGKSVEFKKYLHGICDAGSRLLFKFRSGTHGLNEELGRHRGREGKTECSLCGNECENVSHVLWECSAYSSIRASFI